MTSDNVIHLPRRSNVLNKYILGPDGKTPQLVGLLEWAEWFETGNRIVAKTQVSNSVEVSTVFLGLNHNFGGGPPLLFETMTFGGPNDQYCERCSTWEEAEAQHEIAVQATTIAV